MKKLLGLVPDEEEEKPEKFKAEDLLDDVDIDDFSADEIVFTNQLEDEKPVNVQIETVIILDDDTKVMVTGIEKEKKDQTKDIHDEGVQMTEQQEQEPKRGEAKQTKKEPPIITQTVDTQTPPVKDKEKA